jgi:hypothetical protein
MWKELASSIGAALAVATKQIILAASSNRLRVLVNICGFIIEDHCFNGAAVAYEKTSLHM